MSSRGKQTQPSCWERLKGTSQVFKLLKQNYHVPNYYVSYEKVFENSSKLVIMVLDSLQQILIDHVFLCSQ